MRYADFQKLDPKKSICSEEVADEGDLERAMRHLGNWLKLNKTKLSFVEWSIVSERSYKIVVIYQLKNKNRGAPRFRKYRA